METSLQLLHLCCTGLAVAVCTMALLRLDKHKCECASGCTVKPLTLTIWEHIGGTWDHMGHMGAHGGTWGPMRRSRTGSGTS
jgi:hypothetical protein